MIDLIYDRWDAIMRWVEVQTASIHPVMGVIAALVASIIAFNLGG
jgi:hypothetical protein